MKRAVESVKDLRLAAIAPAIVGHGVLLGILMTVAPQSGPADFEPVPVEIVLLEPETSIASAVDVADARRIPEPDQPGLSNNPDPRLAQAQGGAVNRIEVAEDAPFEALSGFDTAEAVVPETAVKPQQAAQSGRLGEGGDQLSAIRLALRYQACQRLTEKRDPTCPAEDPLVAHLRVAALRDAPRLQQVRVVATAPSNYLEHFVPASERPYLASTDRGNLNVSSQDWGISLEFNPALNLPGRSN